MVDEFKNLTDEEEQTFNDFYDKILNKDYKPVTNERRKIYNKIAENLKKDKKLKKNNY